MSRVLLVTTRVSSDELELLKKVADLESLGVATFLRVNGLKLAKRILNNEKSGRAKDE